MTANDPDAPAQYHDEVDESYADRLRGRGFEPGESIYEFANCFTLEELQKSLFASTYGEVFPVHLRNTDLDLDLPIVAAKVEARYNPSLYRTEDSPTGCYRHPDWYVEGWVIKSGFDPFDEVVRVRIYINADIKTGALDDTFLWQVIPKDPRPDDKFVMVR